DFRNRVRREMGDRSTCRSRGVVVPRSETGSCSAGKGYGPVPARCPAWTRPRVDGISLGRESHDEVWEQIARLRAKGDEGLARPATTDQGIGQGLPRAPPAVRSATLTGNMQSTAGDPGGTN